MSGINMTNTGASANVWAITGGIAPYTTYGVVIRGQQYSITTGSGATEDTQVADPLSSMDIAKSLAAQIPQSIFSVQTSNSTIWIRRHVGGDFTVKVQDSRSNTHTSVCKGKSSVSATCPPWPREASSRKSSGTPAAPSTTTSACSSRPTRATPSDQAWKETVKPGIPASWTRRPCPTPSSDRPTAPSPGPLEWGERICGDEDSAPFPSFVGRTLNGLFFYRNRLSFISGENVVMSRSGSSSTSS
ncbi:MAG: hypothetical protein ACLSAH_09755 [Bilophila wadsworthia]